MNHPFHEIPNSGIPYWQDLHVHSKSLNTSIASSTVDEQNYSLGRLNKTSIKIITKMNETIKNKTNLLPTVSIRCDFDSVVLYEHGDSWASQREDGQFNLNTVVTVKI